MSSSSSEQQELEQSLKNLLGAILVYMEGFLETSEDLKLVEKNLQDYDHLSELVQIITTVFNSLTLKIDQRMSEKAPLRRSTDYDKLELTIQKCEDNIRKHIRNEQSIQLYVETLQQQLDDSEQVRKQFLQQTTKMINSAKRENVVLLCKLKKVNEENDRLSKKLLDLGENQKGYDDKLTQIPEMKEQIQSLLQILQRSSRDMLNKSNLKIRPNTMVKDSSGGKLTSTGTQLKSQTRKKLTDKLRGQSNRAFMKEDLAQLQRQRGVSMNLKRDLSMYYNEIQHKNNSFGQSKHNSQENSLTQQNKKPITSITGRQVRHASISINEQSQRKYKYLF